METDSPSPMPERNAFLVHPFVSEPGVQNQCTLPPQFRLPQFSQASSLILSRIKINSGSERGTSTGVQSDSSKVENSFGDGLTLLLPETSLRSSTTEAEYVYDNDNSFETADINFLQESIPFRPPYEPIEEDDGAIDAPADPTREEAIETQRQAWLDKLPEGVQPAKPELVGFPAGVGASSTALTSYFYGKSRTDLLNILSFCDQLEPQLLVDIFVSVSKRHPGLPIFDAPDWEEKVREQEAVKVAALAAAQARAKAHQRPRHGHTLLNPRMRQRRKVLRKVVKITTNSTTAEAPGKTVVLQEEETEEELLPPTWPKAGEGLYATLPPEEEDTQYLTDDGDDEAFSHFMVDGLGNLTALAACG
ncbi:hypothetical protein V2A60_004527 [Cordyceps javanica]